MTWQRVVESLKALIGLSVVFAMISLGIFLLSLASQTKKTLAGVNTAVVQIVKDADDLKVMTNSTLFQIGDVSHEAADMIRTEKIYVTQESSQLEATSKKLNTTLDQLQIAVKDANDSQRELTASTKDAIETLPGVTTQLQKTLIQTQDTLAKTGDTVKTLNQLLASTQPTINHVNETTGHLDNMSASLDQVVQNATKPQPWYKKVVGYIWAPIKLAALFAK